MQRKQYHYGEENLGGGVYQPLLFCFRKYIRTHSHPDLFMAIQEDEEICSAQRI